MGLDGGTIITRSDVLRGQSWRVASQDTSRSTRGGSVSTGTTSSSADAQQAERMASWTTCSISGESLQAPIVADSLGRLFNKTSIVELLLGKKDIFLDGQSSVHQYANRLRTAPGAYDNIRSLRDVFVVQLQPPGGQEQQGSAPYSCPVTGLPCNRVLFCALRGCGHVLSSRALAIQGEEANTACPVCSKAYKDKHKVLISDTKEKVEAARVQWQQTVRPSTSKKRRHDGDNEQTEAVKTQAKSPSQADPLGTAPVEVVCKQ